MNSQKVFFSYSRVDGSEFALRLAQDLKKKGYDVWIDQEDIRAGSEWDLEIEKALESCDCLLFVETSKSVISNNVLDEVYYAIEQHKKVIPLIFVDSKTPFRLQRLQHIDFTKDYHSGLSLLENELERGSAGAAQPVENTTLTVGKTFNKKYSRLILLLAALVIIAVAAVFYKSTNKNVTPVEENKVVNLNDVYAGNWQLVDVDPKGQFMQGHLKISDVDGKKADIRSDLQFYYSKTNDTLFLSVFNAFANCSSCILKDSMKLNAEDVSIGSREIKVARKDQAGGVKAGDTLKDAGANKSIAASVSLHLTDRSTLTMKVKNSAVVMLSGDLKLEPFVYTFHFKKTQ